MLFLDTDLGSPLSPYSYASHTVRSTVLIANQRERQLAAINLAEVQHLLTTEVLSKTWSVPVLVKWPLNAGSDCFGDHSVEVHFFFNDREYI